jgi:hypothetical protein
LSIAIGKQNTRRRERAGLTGYKPRLSISGNGVLKDGIESCIVFVLDKGHMEIINKEKKQWEEWEK